MADSEQDLLVSAIVVLRPADGREIGGSELITAENVKEYLPDPIVADTVMDFFRSQNFEVEAAYASSFSIVGAKSLFDEFFGSKMRVEASDGVVRSLTTADGDLKLSMERIPEEMVGSLVSIELQPPPDFGPLEY